VWYFAFVSSFIRKRAHGEVKHTFGHQWDDKGRQVYVGYYKPESFDYDKGHLHVYNKMSEEGEEEFLYYDGEVVDGKYHGKGNYFHSNAALKYTGDFENHSEHGLGDETSSDTKKMYSGCYFEGRREGEKGTLFDHEGDEHIVYEGSFTNGHYVNGTLFHTNTFKSYTGTFNESNLFNGEYGEQFSEEEDGRIMFSGPYVEGNLQAETGCKVYYNEKDGPVLYEGGYNDNKYQGVGGIVFYRNGMKKMEGDFAEGNIISPEGHYYYETGVLMYNGPIIDEKFTGDAVTLYTESGGIKYSGPMLESEHHGDGGKLYWNNADSEVLKYEGSLSKG